MEKPNKYANGKIYKIVDNAYTGCYIGSTTQSLSCRMSGHRANYRLYNKDKFNFITVFDMFNLYGIDNCKIELIENFPCDNIEQLLKREGEHIKREDCVNKMIAGRTGNEWYADNREHVKAMVKRYSEANKDWKKAKDKAYYEQHIDKLKPYKHSWCCKQVECTVCKATLNRGSLRRHEKTFHPEEN